MCQPKHPTVFLRTRVVEAYATTAPTPYLAETRLLQSHGARPADHGVIHVTQVKVEIDTMFSRNLHEERDPLSYYDLLTSSSTQLRYFSNQCWQEIWGSLTSCQQVDPLGCAAQRSDDHTTRTVASHPVFHSIRAHLCPTS